jgi:hypothetical protein
MAFVDWTTTPVALYNSYHTWLDDARGWLENTLDDKYGEPYGPGPVWDLWTAWYRQSKQDGAYVHNFEKGTDCYTTVIMPAIHGVRDILHKMESRGVSFYSQWVPRTIIRTTNTFKGDAETLIHSPTLGCFYHLLQIVTNDYRYTTMYHTLRAFSSSLCRSTRT